LKIPDLVVDLNYFSFSHPNPTHLRKHEFLSPYNQFSAYLVCRILLCACVHGVKSEISLDTGSSQIQVQPNAHLWREETLTPDVHA